MELACVWPFFLYSQTYGAYANEGAGTDAFSGLLMVLWQRLVRASAGVLPPRSQVHDGTSGSTPSSSSRACVFISSARPDHPSRNAPCSTRERNLGGARCRRASWLGS